MKYEDVVISLMLICFVLVVSVLIIQSYELKEKDETITLLYDKLKECKNKECVCTLKDINNELTISKDGLRKDNNLYPKIELIK